MLKSQQNLEISLVDHKKERPVDNPVCLIGEITYINDFPNFDLSDDDVLQIEVDLVGTSLVYLWEEDQFHQLRESNEPKQAIYDTNEERFKNAEEGEESLNLFSASLRFISNSFHVIGN